MLELDSGQPSEPLDRFGARRVRSAGGRSDMRLLLLLPVGMLAGTSIAGPPVYVGREVPVAARRPLSEIDHRTWDALLRQFVDGRGLVDYAAWRASSQAMQDLDDYLQALSSARISSDDDRAATLAFWINAYNALTIKGILREYPTSSIRNHTSRFLGYNIWKDLRLWVDGKPRSLDQIEHDILRKSREPRIHFAIVCASLGCPRLRNEAYIPARLEDQLADNARDFFADTRRFQVDAQQKIVRVSPILDWFGEDFGRDLTERMRTIAPFLAEDGRRAALDPHVTVEFLDYDWALNDRSTHSNAP